MYFNDLKGPVKKLNFVNDQHKSFRFNSIQVVEQLYDIYKWNSYLSDYKYNLTRERMFSDKYIAFLAKCIFKDSIFYEQAPIFKDSEKLLELIFDFALLVKFS